jgi:Flp pilus assembly secretin CpaC
MRYLCAFPYLLSVLSIAFAVSTGVSCFAQEKLEQPQATPIPPVNSGTIDLQEIKPTAAVDVKAGQSRVFKTKTKILRVSVSDPAIAEPIVVSEREFVLLGKAPGAVSLFLWCEGDSAASKKPI